MRRTRAIFAALLVSALVAACGGTTVTPVPSAAPSAAPSASPSPAPSAPGVSLPSLPTGWARHEAPGAFTIGVPETWLVLTSTERDDPTAATALKAKYPTYSTAIDSSLGQMRDQGLFIFAFDVSGDTSVFATNMNILKVPGPLDQASATSAAAVVQKQFKLDTPLNVEAVTTLAGAYRYQFAENLVATSMAGIQYLFPSGSDMYVMTFLTTVAQAAAYGPTVVSMAGTFAATSATGAAPVATTTPAASPAPAALPAGFARFDLGTGMLIGLPAAWMTMTTAERDDPSAEAAFRTTWPDQKMWIDALLPIMKNNGELIFSLDVKGPGPTNFPTQFSVDKYAGPLTLDWATTSAAGVQKNYKITTPFEILPVTKPAGSYRYQWVDEASTVPTAGAKYLIPVGSDVYELTLTVSLPLAPSYSPILTSIVESLSIASASVTPAPPAASLESAKFDPSTGKSLDESMPDVCVLVSLATVKAASGYSDTVQNQLHLWDACEWTYPDKSGVDLTVERYIDAAHASAAIAAQVAHPGMAGHSWAALSGVGDSAFVMDKNGGDAMAVVGSWLVISNVGSAAPATTRTDTAVAVLKTALATVRP